MTLPPDFIIRTKALINNEFDSFEKALQQESPVAIRINTAKGINTLTREAVAWSETGYYLQERLPFTFDPLFHAGNYYVQEASSMFMEQAIINHIKEPVKCLDLCAAPGGKSTHLAAILPKGSLLVSNEVIRSRSHILAENMAKWGNPNTIVTNNDPEDIGKLKHFFDIIIADVPCSGEGMFRKDPDTMAEWSLTNVNLCANRQRRIIHDVWNALKPGGILVYSTCTYNTEENEDNIHYITEELGGEALSIPVNKEWNITGALKYNHPVYRFFPHKTKGEGFFLATLRKAEGEMEEIRIKSKGKRDKGKVISTIPPSIHKWLNDPESFDFEMDRDTIKAIPIQHKESCKILTEKLHIVASGISLGEIKGKDIIPCHPLSLSTSLNSEAFPSADVSWKEAIRFLKKEALILTPENEKGYHLITYNGSPLGFVKNLGNRANNLYPQEWRIRSGYLPDKIPSL